MRKLSSLILILVFSARLFSQTSPHGAGIELNCMECHSTSGWKVDLKNLTFNHGATKFPLTGQHTAVSCKMCHTSLEFAKAGTECIDCHTDMHNQTVGPNCARCHTPASWIVNNITELHQQSRFPLVGAHAAADCYDCHINASSSLLNFQPMGVDCYDCHQNDYLSTTNPNHSAGNYSTNCTACHNMNAYSWTGAGLNHNFFPLTLGHDINDCKRCHTTPDYSSTSPECLSCHSNDYNNTSNPAHGSNGFSQNCQVCHSTNPGWNPVTYRDHDAQYFPIYSGEHQGEWNKCSDCHTNASNYGQYTCTQCHDHNMADMNKEHEGVQGYFYNDPACFACHPTGSASGTFNHGNSAFPLTGAHATTDCIKCHSTGYAGTPTVCNNCHNADYTQSVNPNHITSNFPTSCETCHSTTAWAPSTFDHNNTYPLTGAHAIIASNCVQCHQGNYVNTPNTCEGCHMPNYNTSANPAHLTLNIPTDCNTCHTTNPDWKPATFPIHNNYYILAGAHIPIANNCGDCHNGNYNATPNTCIGCHLTNYNQTNNPPHAAAQFPVTCTDCHTQSAWTPANWDHDGQYFPIYSGKHNGEWNSCSDCHTNPGNYSVFTCTTSCHPQSSMNNKHQGVSGYSYNSAACLDCHPDGSGGKMFIRTDQKE